MFARVRNGCRRGLGSEASGSIHRRSAVKKSFKLGDLVKIDPTGRGFGKVGKIVGLVTWLDGSPEGYFVSAAAFDGVERNLFSSMELMPLDEE